MQEISHFLSVDSCDSLPLTRLEGVKELSRQLHDNKGQIRELLKESHGTAVPEQLQDSPNCTLSPLFTASCHRGLTLRPVLQLSGSHLVLHRLKFIPQKSKRQPTFYQV